MIIENSNITKVERLSADERALVKDLHKLILDREIFYKELIEGRLSKGMITYTDAHDDYLMLIESDSILKNYKMMMNQIFLTSFAATIILNREEK